ncbi:coiled-coil domain-containing protein 157 [Opisthocomus hoazin]|uniref:coiled-coil domain-containing protein 157 n=1 Tax=Opisthocomus hoazin TaxID=30419 RepID=UPI003F52D450
MAHLLGHPGCMESLRADLRDLQAAIADVSSRTGAVRFPSWKFPHKVSCELDLVALLEQYRYTEGDPQFTQHSHVVLLELLIDRLLLLLQSFTGYSEHLLSEQVVPPAQALGPSLSAGLTARRYWCSMLKLGAVYQQLLAEKKPCSKEIPTLQSTAQAGRPEKGRPKRCLPDVVDVRPSTGVAQSTPLRPSPGVRSSCSVPLPALACSTPESSCSVPLPALACSTADSSRSVHTQTAAASLEPCDACASTQGCLRDVGRAITRICQSQNIPSALTRFQEKVDETTGRGTLSAKDISYWASEQTKDLSRISKHLQLLLQQVNPLKSQLEASHKQKDELHKQLEDLSRVLQAEKEAQARQTKEAEQKLAVKNKEHSEAVARLEQDRDDLRRGAALLEERLSAFKEELAAKQAAVQELERSKMTLLEELRTTTAARSRVLELEEEVRLLTGQRDSLGQELSAASSQLPKEKAKVQSMLRHQESLQAKYQLLLQDFDSLDQEREELQASLEEAEEDRARLAEQLQQSQEQSGRQLREQQELLDAQQREKRSLEQSVAELRANGARLEQQAQELRERERLLVFFPELHSPAGTQLQSTGSVAEEMEQHVQANSVRISVLQQENARLGAALAKLKAAAQQGVLQLVPQSRPGSQLDSQDAGRPSSPGSSDGAGTRGHAAQARHRAPGSQPAQPLSAQPARQPGACLSLPGLRPEPPGRVRPPTLPRTGARRK